MTRFERIEAQRKVRELKLAMDRNMAEAAKPRIVLHRDPGKSVAPAIAWKRVPRRGPRWAVYRVFDDGRRELVESGFDEVGAAVRAGYYRDTMTDSECAGDFNYESGKL